MNLDYRFRSTDGRIGYGWSCWAAIVAAIGAGEAAILPELHEVDWMTAGVSPDASKRANVLSAAGDRWLGELEAIKEGGAA